MLKCATCVTLFLLLISLRPAAGQKGFGLRSPSGKIEVLVTINDTVHFSVQVDGQPVISPSPVALLLHNKPSAGIKSHLQKKTTRSADAWIDCPVPVKRKQVRDHFNELTLRFKENFSLVCRAYDDGVAYRFQTHFPDSVQVDNEIAGVNFPGTATAYFPEVQKRDNADAYLTSFEEPYQVLPVERISSSKMAFSPLLVDNGALKVVITESDLMDYPGMFLRGTDSRGLRADFAPYPAREEIQGGEFKQWVATQRKDFIARTAGTRSFPWRVFMVAGNDREIPGNDLVYRLASPPASQDWSWVAPGMCTDEWICGINLHGVDFKAGLNTASYKYYIDFAKHFGIPYVMLDAGWSDNDDLFKINPQIDLEAVAAYAHEKGIGLFLWTLAMTLDRQLEPALNMFNKLGVRGINTDFMDRDDQKMVRFYSRIAEATARHKIMVMFHGAYKNAGFERTFPNAITRESVLGSEYNIWSEKATPEHDLILPFTRMTAGAMDYEPGFLENANQQTFRPLPDKVMSMGTRTHQLAMFIVYDSPLQVFSGNPSDAWLEEPYMKYLASIPASWDETVIVDARVSDYIVTARRKGNDWFIGAMTDWTARDLEIDLSFLGEGNFSVFICEDGPNAEKNAKDYRLPSKDVGNSRKLPAHLAPGGGFVARLVRK